MEPWACSELKGPGVCLKGGSRALGPTLQVRAHHSARVAWASCCALLETWPFTL